jgi:hypothetical protein
MHPNLCQVSTLLRARIPSCLPSSPKARLPRNLRPRRALLQCKQSHSRRHRPQQHQQRTRNRRRHSTATWYDTGLLASRALPASTAIDFRTDKTTPFVCCFVSLHESRPPALSRRCSRSRRSSARRRPPARPSRKCLSQSTQCRWCLPPRRSPKKPAISPSPCTLGVSVRCSRSCIRSARCSDPVSGMLALAPLLLLQPSRAQPVQSRRR